MLKLITEEKKVENKISSTYSENVSKAYSSYKFYTRNDEDIDLSKISESTKLIYELYSKIAEKKDADKSATYLKGASLGCLKLDLYLKVWMKKANSYDNIAKEVINDVYELFKLKNAIYNNYQRNNLIEEKNMTVFSNKYFGNLSFSDRIINYFECPDVNSLLENTLKSINNMGNVTKIKLLDDEGKIKCEIDISLIAKFLIKTNDDLWQ